MQIDLSHSTAHVLATVLVRIGWANKASHNSGACSGGQGVRPSQRALPLEATRPGLLGTPGLVFSSRWRPIRLALARFFGPSNAAGRLSGFHIHLKSAFYADGPISVLWGLCMWNGWKKAAIGLTALGAFILLELIAVIGGIAVFLGAVLDVDLPFLAFSEE